MINELVQKSIIELNKLDPKVPTVFKVDLAKNIMVGTQDCSTIIYFNNLISLASAKSKGKFIYILHPNDVTDIRDALLYFINHINESTIEVNSKGFTLGRFREYLGYGGILTKKYGKFLKIKVINRVFLGKLLYLTSKTHRFLIKYISKVE